MKTLLKILAFIMNQFPNIPESVKEDIRKRAEERFKFLPNEDRDEATAHWNGLVFSQQSGYVIALCEAWEMMQGVCIFCESFMTAPQATRARYISDKQYFLTRIFKK